MTALKRFLTFVGAIAAILAVISFAGIRAEAKQRHKVQHIPGTFEFTYEKRVKRIKKARRHRAAQSWDMAAIPAYGDDHRYPLLQPVQPMGRSHIAPSNGWDMADGNRARRTNISFIPNPAGTWRVAVSCAHRLAAYWSLGTGLDKVSTWKHRFARANGPGIGMAAVRHSERHIMGIIGGGPGAWRVADFNSGGHLNREYTVANLSGYYFLDTRNLVSSL